jgi:hypothetical protein
VLDREQPKNYEAVIGLGIALRGLGDHGRRRGRVQEGQGASTRSAERRSSTWACSTRTSAPNKENDLKAMQNTSKVAKQFFQDFMGKDGSQGDKDEAQENIKAIDKLVKQLDEAMKMAASQPPPPAPTPAPAGGGQ